MELIYKVMPDDYTLVHASDTHIGPLCCHQEGIKDMVERVNDDHNCFLVFSGDAIDAITNMDKRFAHTTFDKNDLLFTPQEQAKRCAELFMPIKDKIIAWGLGNHDHKVINTFDVCGDICERLGTVWGGVIFKFIATHKNGRVRHKFLFCHGSGALKSAAKDPIQREANRKAALKQKLDNTRHTDCVYMGCGHHHQKIIVRPTYNQEIILTDEKNIIKQHYRYSVPQNADYIPPECRWYGCSPGFLKTYTPPGSRVISYAEMANYGPTTLGWLELKVEGGELVDVQAIEIG